MEPKTDPTLLFQAEFPFGQMHRGKAMIMEVITRRGKAWQRRPVHTKVKKRHQQWPQGRKPAALHIHSSKKDRVSAGF